MIQLCVRSTRKPAGNNDAVVEGTSRTLHPFSKRSPTWPPVQGGAAPRESRELGIPAARTSPGVAGTGITKLQQNPNSSSIPTKPRPKHHSNINDPASHASPNTLKRHTRTLVPLILDIPTHSDSKRPPSPPSHLPTTSVNRDLPATFSPSASIPPREARPGGTLPFPRTPRTNPNCEPSSLPCRRRPNPRPHPLPAHADRKRLARSHPRRLSSLNTSTEPPPPFPSVQRSMPR